MITTQLTNSVQSHIDEVLHELIDIRHDIHAHPELGYAETRTSQVIQDFLRSHDISFKAGLAKGTGVLGHIGIDRHDNLFAVSCTASDRAQIPR